MRVRIWLGVFMALNVVLDVGLFGLSKYLWSTEGFHFTVLLSALHSLSATLATRVLRLRGILADKPIPFGHAARLAAGAVGSMGFMTLSLATNSVGFYTFSKLACLPASLALEWYWHGKVVSKLVKASVVALLVGASMATVYDVSVSMAGTIYAVCDIFATVYFQIMSNRYYRELKCNELQLLHHVAPLMCLGTAPLIPLFDDMVWLRDYDWLPQVYGLLFISCVLALAVQITSFLVLGNASPTTYQVLGYMKAFLILKMGYTLFRSPLDSRNTLGMVIALLGALMYAEGTRLGAATNEVSAVTPAQIWETEKLKSPSRV
ncbi:unnamed protein product [Chrysoparadoxa australica]